MPKPCWFVSSVKEIPTELVHNTQILLYTNSYPVPYYLVDAGLMYFLQLICFDI